LEKKPKRARYKFYVLFGIFVFQLLSTLICFHTPWELFKAEPVVNIDWCSQYYWSFCARKFLEYSGRIWGFDPYYMAGYPLDFVFNSSLPVQLANIIFKAIPVGMVIKWTFFLSFLVAPFVFYFSFRIFGLSVNEALAGTAMGISYFWLGEEALFGNFGMISGAFMLNFFLLSASVLFRYFKNANGRGWVWVFVFLATSFLIHKTSAVLVGIPFLILVVLFGKRLDKRAWLRLLLAGLLALLINSFWLFPFFKFLPYKIENPLTTFFQNTDPLRFIKDIAPFGAFWGVGLARLLILSFAIYGLSLLRKTSGKKMLFKFLTASCVIFFLLVYFGSFFSPLRHIQPYRYLTGFYFLLALASGIGLESLRKRIEQKSGLARSAVWGFFGFLFLLQFSPNYRLLFAVSPLTSNLPAKVVELEKWL